MYFLYSLLVGACVASTCDDKAFFKDAGPLVKLKVGSVVGKYAKVFDTDVAAFLGIPFGTVPARFARPRPADPWKGVLLTTEKPPQCPQYSEREYDWIPVNGTNSEDCLYLNVWSPSRRCCDTSRKLPVMVWIHGGGFIYGSSSMDLYDGSVLASYGDVVVVTFNYRVGVFGFLSSGTEEAPGNAAFYDQVMALEWVRDNIEQFGGDPSDVTLFGESAGSISTSMHMVSPLSRGLFHRAILISGTAYQPYLMDTPQTAQLKLKLFSEAAGCSSGGEAFQDNVAQVVQCLKEKDADTLMRTEDTFAARFPLLFLFLDGTEAIPKHPIEYYDSGEVAQVEVMMGNVGDEGNVFLNYIMPELFPVDARPQVQYDQVDATLRTLLPMMQVPSIEAVKEFYFPNGTDTDVDDVVRGIGHVFGDFVFNCPTLFTAEKLTSVHLYWDTHRSQKDDRDEWLGSPHFDDVSYVFGHPIVDSRKYTPEDGRYSGDKIQKMVSFARTGNPLNPESKEVWSKFDSENPSAHELNPRKQEDILHPRAEACKFWRPYFKALAAEV